MGFAASQSWLLWVRRRHRVAQTFWIKTSA